MLREIQNHPATTSRALTEVELNFSQPQQGAWQGKTATRRVWEIQEMSFHQKGGAALIQCWCWSCQPGLLQQLSDSWSSAEHSMGSYDALVGSY